MNFGKWILSSSIAIAATLALASCGPGASDAGDGAAGEASAERPFKVVSTVGMITDVVRNLVGEHAEVEGLIGEGVDPHLYKPTRGDLVKLREADIIFYNGLLLEGQLTDALEAQAAAGKPVRAVTELIVENPDYLLTEDGESQLADPHVWMDVGGWMKGVPVIAEALADFDPENATDYAANAAAYLEKLERLDAYAERVIATIPENQRVLVTAHDAFRYLGRAYGIEVRGIQGISTESEAGVRDLERLVDFIVENEIPAVFAESSVADKNVRALVEGARARGHEVAIGGELFSDAMGEPGTYEGTYIGMIDHNVTTIARALGGSAEGFRAEKESVTNPAQ